MRLLVALSLLAFVIQSAHAVFSRCAVELYCNTHGNSPMKVESAPNANTFVYKRFSAPNLSGDFYYMSIDTYKIDAANDQSIFVEEGDSSDIIKISLTATDCTVIDQSGSGDPIAVGEANVDDTDTDAICTVLAVKFTAV